MIKKTINYVDEFGEQQTLEAWFHLTKKQAMSVMGNISTDWDMFIDDLVNKRISFKEVIGFADDLILSAFGIRENGQYKKTKDLREWFAYSEAFSKFFMDMMQDPEGKEFLNFMEALTPKEDADRIVTAKTTKPAAAKPSVVGSTTPDWAKTNLD
jgi:hypothetical protein